MKKEGEREGEQSVCARLQDPSKELYNGWLVYMMLLMTSHDICLSVLMQVEGR